MPRLDSARRPLVWMHCSAIRGHLRIHPSIAAIGPLLYMNVVLHRGAGIACPDVRDDSASHEYEENGMPEQRSASNVHPPLGTSSGLPASA
mmetsp:Transcript_52303/g.147239  ORF Transcript_52303/g.147239 Transcript_52303/m.147239 type:complete len:91 (+) Transcript_52303:241-513(+)